MKLIFSVVIILFFSGIFSCENILQNPDCQLVKFNIYTVSSNINHFDFITLKNRRIERIYSYDHRISRNDTVNKTILFFKYNSAGQVIQISDESPTKNIVTFDFEHDSDGKIIKSTEKTLGVEKAEIRVEYNSTGRQSAVRTSNLLGLSRDYEYDADQNLIGLLRYDSTPITLYKYEFDDAKNFFGGIPDIQYLWLVRPLYNFLPYGNHNIKLVRVFNQRGVFWVEDPALKSTRQIEYNDKGYPLIIRRLNDNGGGTLISESKFEYDCQ